MKPLLFEKCDECGIGSASECGCPVTRGFARVRFGRRRPRGHSMRKRRPSAWTVRGSGRAALAHRSCVVQRAGRRHRKRNTPPPM